MCKAFDQILCPHTSKSFPEKKLVFFLIIQSSQKIIQPKGLDKQVNEVRPKKVELAYNLTKDLHNKSQSQQKQILSLQHTSKTSECLYATKCLVLNKKRERD